MTRPLHIHVEEPSMRAFLDALLPRQLDPAVVWRIIDHGSKQRLLADVPKRLLGYRHHRDPASRPKALVLVDRDADDCLALKAQLETACAQAGLATRGTAPDGPLDVVNRIVVDELEAWYFGDVPAMRAVWPGVPATLGRQARFRAPDAIAGGAYAALSRVVKRAGGLPRDGRLPKIDTARRMGGWIEPARAISPSFHAFLTGLDALVATT